jgi:hypothetical protein
VLAGVGMAEWVAGTRRHLAVRVAVLAVGIAGLAAWMAARGERIPAVFRATGPTWADSAAALRAVAAICSVVAVAVATLFVLRLARHDGRPDVAPAPLTVAVVAGAVVALATVGANHLEWRRWADHGIPLADADQRWARDGVRFRRSTSDEARIAFSAAGAQAYFSDRPAIDLLGKSDRRIARQRPRTEEFRPGHNKFDFEYSVGDLRPDLVASGGFGASPRMLPHLDRWRYHVAGAGELVRDDSDRVDEAALEPRPGETS